MKIGIIGKMCSGKSTCSEYLKKKYNFKKFSFGDSLKKYAKEIFDLDNSVKNREIYIKFGLKLREIDDFVWINHLKKKLPSDETQHIVVDDIRFNSEYEELKKMGFLFLKLEINQELQINRIKKNHPKNYKEHIKYINHISESLSDILDANYIFKVTKNSEKDIFMFLDNIITN
mgnify:CR=1 FL=1